MEYSKVCRTKHLGFAPKISSLIQLVFIFFITIIASPVYAVCPICTLAVGAGIGLTTWLGIDDVITGLWIGGLTVSMIVWTISWLNKKNIHFKGRKILVTTLYFLFIVFPLYTQGFIGHMLNKLWGIDKLLLGIIIGAVVFFASSLTYDLLKKNNAGKAYFPLQKVIMPVGALIILSFIFYFITK